MHGELVAVDLETTGFDPAQDEIIEIGAVRISDGEVIETFSSFVNPRRDIPHAVTLLTGIRSQDVIDAPELSSVLNSLEQFVGSSAWIAHNISFDASFLNKRGVLLSNVRIDTYELASILIPNAPRYTLGSIAEYFGIDIGSAHRALDDARASALVYWQLWGILQSLPANVIAEILFFAGGLRWDGRIALEESLREKNAAPADMAVRPAYFTPASARHTAPQRSVDHMPINIDDMQALLRTGGSLALHFAEYEERAAQPKMAAAVGQAFNDGQPLMIEAGTGTGKSLAYLTPALLWSAQNQERVVISTNTIPLQEQLLTNDIPRLRAALNLDISAALLKGRTHYLCPRRFEVTRRRQAVSVEELRVFAKILVAAELGWQGDRSGLSLRGDEEGFWQRLSAEDEHCTEAQCEARLSGSCPFYKARRAAEDAHLLVVNHALLIADALAENSVLPDYEYLVIDEAHQLEEAVTNGLTAHFDEVSIRGQLSFLGSISPQRGLLGQIASSVESVLPAKANQRFRAFAADISDAIAAMHVHITQLFRLLRAFAGEQRPQSISDQNLHFRVTDNLRSSQHFMAAQQLWAILNEFFDTIAGSMQELGSALANASRNEPASSHFADLVSAVNASASRLTDLRDSLNRFLMQPQPNDIYWLTLSQDASALSVHFAPLYVGGYVKRLLLDQKRSVIMTSATLQIGGSFKFIQQRLGCEGVRTLSIESPFDYQQAVMLYLPNDLPDPTDKGRYQAAVERGIIELASVLGGRTLVLFTSYAQLRQTSAAIAPRLKLGGIDVLDQSDGRSRQAILDGFKNAGGAVLLGTRSFWEGIDIPGEALSALVIVRLPFAVPTDPVVQARAETFPDSFNDYSVPDAVLRFRQGFGRLIRSKTDRGVITVFDNRLLTKAYGAEFLDALPSPTLETGPLSELPNAAKRWLKLTLS